MIPVVLFVLFLVLKLVGVIGWSWVWVTAPLWIPVLLQIVLTVFVGIPLALLARRHAKKQTASTHEAFFGSF